MKKIATKNLDKVNITILDKIKEKANIIFIVILAVSFFILGNVLNFYTSNIENYYSETLNYLQYIETLLRHNIQ